MQICAPYSPLIATLALCLPAVTEVVTSWSAMDYMSADHVPYMGYLLNGTNSMYTATGK